MSDGTDPTGRPSRPAPEPATGSRGEPLGVSSGAVRAEVAGPTYTRLKPKTRLQKLATVAGIIASLVVVVTALIGIGYFLERLHPSLAASQWRRECEAANELLRSHVQELETTESRIRSLEGELSVERSKRTDNDVRAENQRLREQVEVLKSQRTDADARQTAKALESESRALRVRVQQLEARLRSLEAPSPGWLAWYASWGLVALTCLLAAFTLRWANRRRARAWNERGTELGLLGHHKQALYWLSRATSSCSTFAEAWSNKGVALGQLERTEEALAAYERAIEIKPDLAEAWSNKGVALGQLERTEEELGAYERAIEIKPDYAKAWYNRACVRARVSQPKELVLDDLRNAIRLDPESRAAASKEKDFEALERDPDFLALVGEGGSDVKHGEGGA